MILIIIVFVLFICSMSVSLGFVMYNRSQSQQAKVQHQQALDQAIQQQIQQVQQPQVRKEFKNNSECESAFGSLAFFDPIQGGKCFSCPQDFNRTWEHIEHNNACSQGISGPFSRASKLN